MKNACLILLLLCLSMINGCKMFGYGAYVLFGGRETKVKAEYKGLENQTVALLVATTPDVEFRYPTARKNISLAVQKFIERKVKHVSFVKPEIIQAFQEKNLSWVNWPITKIARQFDTTRLMYIDLYQYTMREEQSIQILRARIKAAVRIYENDGEHPDRPAWSGEISIVWPEHIPRAMSDSNLQEIQLQSILKFADELAKKFYNHKVLDQ